MNTLKDGGPAFPAEPNWLEPETAEIAKQMARGMTLRDYFAGQALAGTLPGAKLDVDEYAQLAYRMADAMLRARGQS